jgi:hypothetical protein
MHVSSTSQNFGQHFCKLTHSALGGQCEKLYFREIRLVYASWIELAHGRIQECSWYCTILSTVLYTMWPG